MARPKRTAAAAAQTGAAQNRTAEVKKAAEVKTAEDVKKADEPAVKEAVKETVKKPVAAAKEEIKETVKETVKPEIEKSVVVEFGGRQVAAKDVLAQAEKAYAKSHPGTVIKSMELYISPEQNAAYYVVNGEGSDDFRIDL
ncbi:DUF6465 family protein [Enterocloster bolteae]|uniref:DUF6465 family protein n=1 Tax=Enterocloster bolteae TaxID=208479 RepID=UPI00210A412A|nr:DUF6465 family protein [Enterocloster bolteae]MCQ5141708.1 DUF6465 family protein [Enterocloster bolteae]